MNLLPLVSDWIIALDSESSSAAPVLVFPSWFNVPYIEYLYNVVRTWIIYNSWIVFLKFSQALHTHNTKYFNASDLLERINSMNGSTTGQQQGEASSSENSEGVRRRRSSFGRAAEDNKENEVLKDYTDEQVQMVRRYDCEGQYTFYIIMPLARKVFRGHLVFGLSICM